MVRTLLGQIKAYKRAAMITPLLTALEVFLEILIPVTAFIIDKCINEFEKNGAANVAPFSYLPLQKPSKYVSI